MARTAFRVVASSLTAGVVAPAGTAIDQANGMNIPLASGAIPRIGTAHQLVLVVHMTAVGAHSVIVRAGATPVPAFRGALGDLTVAETGTQDVYITLEAARFMQTDNSINVDFTAGSTGTIIPLLVAPSQGA